MNVRALPNTLVFSGILDEQTLASDLQDGVEKLKKTGMSHPVNADFSGVSYANSTGVVTWLKFLAGSKLSLRYVNSPGWLVSQFNSIQGYFENGSFAESIQAPYFSQQTQESKYFTLVLGRDIPLLDDYSAFTLPLRTDGSTKFEIDFLPEQYFSFIVDNLKTFQEKIK